MARYRKILGDSLKLGGRQAAGMFFSAIQTLIAARYLEPAGFGTFAIVSTAAMMASICGPGLLGAGFREVPHHQSLGNAKMAESVINHAAFGELAVAMAWAAGIAAFSVFQDNKQLLPMLMIVAISVVPAKIVGIFQLVAYREKNFDLQSKVDLSRAGITALLVIALIQPLGIYIVLLAPILANLIGAALYARRYRLALNVRGLRVAEFARLARIGLPITGANIVNSMSGLQRWAERLLIHSFLGIAMLGVFAFANWIALTVMTLAGSIMQSIQPHIYDVMSRDLDEKEIQAYLLRPMWSFAIGGAILFGLCAATLPDLVAGFLAPYAIGIPIMQCLLFAAYLNCVFGIPTIMIYSVSFNGQSFAFLACSIGVLASIIGAATLMYFGMGAIAAAIGFVTSQLLVGALTLARVWKYLFPQFAVGRYFFGSMIAPLMNIVVAIVVIHYCSSLSAPLPESWYFHVFVALIKGTAFLVLTIPATVALERKTGIYCEHIRAYCRNLLIRAKM